MRRILCVGRRCLLAGSICALLLGASWAADDSNKSDITKRIDASAKVLNEIMATPDKAIPDKVMGKAKCLAVIPSMVKIAVGFGGNPAADTPKCRAGSRETSRETRGVV